MDNINTRLSLLEQRVAQMEKSIETTKTSITHMDGKLDQLLELKAKGMGAFWLVSLIFGSGVLASIVSAITWWRG